MAVCGCVSLFWEKLTRENDTASCALAYYNADSQEKVSN